MVKVCIETYGCQMNFSDTELVAGLLTQNGFEIVESMEEADSVLLNTCAIRENAEEKIHNRVTQIGYYKRRRPGLRVGILGCLAQSLKDELLERSTTVDFLVGPDSYRTLPELLAPGMALKERRNETTLSRTETYTDIPFLRKSGVNAWVTIMRGCDNFCTFCVVPYTRGRERSRELEDVVREAESLARAGFRQITLLGQNVNSYRSGGADFTSLLEAVCRVEGIDRVRFTSPHPKDFPVETLEIIAREEAACPHIHLPLQAGGDRVLERMGRGYTLDDFRRLAGRIREIVPGVAISTDLIAGFPGETEEEFEQTLLAMEELRFISAFTFAYSERKNTIAVRRFPDDISQEVKVERVSRMVELQRRISRELHSAQRGERVEVLVEGSSKKSRFEAFGRTPQGVGVVFPAELVNPGELVQVEITDSTTNTLIGREMGRTGL